MPSSSRWFVCLLSLHLCSSLLSAASEPASVQPSGPAVYLHDGSIIRNVILVGSLELATKYGKVTIPVKDVKRIQVGLRLTKEEARGIDQVIEQLRSSDLKSLDRTAQRIQAFGLKAFPALRKVVRSDDGVLSLKVEPLLVGLLNSFPIDPQRIGTEDVVSTADCTFVGRLAGDTIKVRSKLLGEKELKLADVLLIDLGRGGASPAAPVKACSLQEIVKLSRSGVTDQLIINQIRTSWQARPLTADEIIYLKQNGVSDQVIQELQAGGNGQPRVVYTEWITGPVDVTESVPRDSSRPLLPK